MILSQRLLMTFYWYEKFSRY